MDVAKREEEQMWSLRRFSALLCRFVRYCEIAIDSAAIVQNNDTMCRYAAIATLWIKTERHGMPAILLVISSDRYPVINVVSAVHLRTALSETLLYTYRAGPSGWRGINPLPNNRKCCLDECIS